MWEKDLFHKYYKMIKINIPISAMLLSRYCNIEDVAKIFRISIEEVKQIHRDITKLIENVYISIQEYDHRINEINSFYKIN